jgi:hypothetical protein
MKIHINPILFLAIPLVLSAYTHLWNIAGFPSVHVDEAHYMRRAMLVSKNLGPQDPYYQYDHPYFGQIFLAAVLGMIGYPNSLNPSADGNVHSIEMLYLVPRVLMGLLAVLDTFLVYKIAERRYSRNVALIASVVFAVMPATWLLRRIYLDSILLPFLLSSILLAIYTKSTKVDTKDNHNSVGINRNIIVLLSGILLGLSIYTKIPAFTMIPLVGLLIYQNNNKSLKTLGLWFIPVILIPLMWPAYSISVGQFDEWRGGFQHQTQRTGIPLLDSVTTMFEIDPVMVSLGTAGLVFTIIKRDFFCLLWIVPFTLFSVGIGYLQYFHLIIILPALCIAIGRLIEGLSTTIIKSRIRQNSSIFCTVVIIGIFGLISSSILITSNVNSSYFQTYAFVVQYPPHVDNDHNKNERVTLVTNHWWGFNLLWISSYVLGEPYDFLLAGTDGNIPKTPVKTEKALLLLDQSLKDKLFNNPENTKNIQALQLFYNKSKTIRTFVENEPQSYNGTYPYTSMKAMISNEKRPFGKLEVRAN